MARGTRTTTCRCSGSSTPKYRPVVETSRATSTARRASAIASFVERAAKGSCRRSRGSTRTSSTSPSGRRARTTTIRPPTCTAGQKLALALFDAVVQEPSWEKTMLVIVTYDEHGGFYDHVPPPACARRLVRRSGRYGPRVPGARRLAVRGGAGRSRRRSTTTRRSSRRSSPASAAEGGRDGPEHGRARAAAQHLGELLTRPTARRIKRPSTSRSSTTPRAGTRRWSQMACLRPARAWPSRMS